MYLSDRNVFLLLLTQKLKYTFLVYRFWNICEMQLQNGNCLTNYALRELQFHFSLSPENKINFPSVTVEAKGTDYSIYSRTYISPNIPQDMAFTLSVQ